jgi:RNA polymerase sigma-70 factor (ECF subfamily)
MERYDAEDAYQDAFLAVYQNIRDGKLTTLTVTFKTYLFSIGKNKIVDKFRKMQNEIELIPLFSTIYYEAESIDEKKQMLVYRSVTQMGDPCKTILYSFYYEEKSMNDIAKTFNYSSSDVAKQQKSRCMKKIATIINEQFKQEKLI